MKPEGSREDLISEPLLFYIWVKRAMKMKIVAILMTTVRLLGRDWSLTHHHLADFFPSVETMLTPNAMGSLVHGIHNRAWFGPAELEAVTAHSRNHIGCLNWRLK